MCGIEIEFGFIVVIYLPFEMKQPLSRFSICWFKWIDLGERFARGS